MIAQRQQYFAVADVAALGINDDRVGEDNLHARIGMEEFRYRLQCAWQILFVTVQISEPLAARSAQAAIHRVVHPGVLFYERPHPLVLLQPVQRPVIRDRILDDVFHLDSLLVRDGSDAELEPFGLPKTGSNDGKAHQPVFGSCGPPGGWHVAFGKTRMIALLSNNRFAIDPMAFRYTEWRISHAVAPSMGKLG